MRRKGGLFRLRADFLVLVVGGRRGGTHVGSEKSITNEEYRRALKRKIPVVIFVKKDVEGASRLYRKNPTADFSEVVDDVRVFDFIDGIRSRSEDNWVRPYETVTDIIGGLRAQFAYLHLLFSKRHVAERQPKTKQTAKDSDVAPFPGDFSGLAPETDDELERTSLISGLKAIHGTVKKIRESGVTGIDEKLKVLWLLGRYGTLKDDRLRMPEAQFKQRAWSTYRGQRVFDQLNEFGIWGSYETADAPDGREISVVDLGLGEPENAWALNEYVRDLVKRFGEEEGLDLFTKADMRFYAGDDGTPARTAGKVRAPSTIQPGRKSRPSPAVLPRATKNAVPADPKARDRKPAKSWRIS